MINPKINIKQILLKNNFLYLLLLIGIAIAGIVAWGIITLLYPPIEVILASIHEFGHAFSATITGGTVNAINITINRDSGTLALMQARTTTDGGIDQIIIAGGMTFALIISVIIGKVPYLKWFAPILAGRNIVNLIPYSNPASTSDGYQILHMAYGPILFGIIAFIDIALCLYVSHVF